MTHSSCRSRIGEGGSLVNDFTPELQLDWAFYERRFGDNTLLRIGKAPIPMGISNERTRHPRRDRRQRGESRE